jgi:methyl-accepting chemotaxis protein
VNTNQSIKSRLTGVIALLSALLLCIGIMGLFGIYRANDDLRSVYADRTLGLSQITQIDRLILRNRLLLEESIIDPTPEVVQKKVAEAEANIAEITRLWDVFSKHELSAEEQGLAKQFGEARARFVKEGLSLAIDHLKKDEAHIAMQVDTDHVQRLYPAVKQSIDALNKQFVDKAQEALPGLAKPLLHPAADLHSDDRRRHRHCRLARPVADPGHRRAARPMRIGVRAHRRGPLR